MMHSESVICNFFICDYYYAQDLCATGTHCLIFSRGLNCRSWDGWCDQQVFCWHKKCSSSTLRWLISIFDWHDATTKIQTLGAWMVLCLQIDDSVSKMIQWYNAKCPKHQEPIYCPKTLNKTQSCHVQKSLCFTWYWTNSHNGQYC